MSELSKRVYIRIIVWATSVCVLLVFAGIQVCLPLRMEETAMFALTMIKERME